MLVHDNAYGTLEGECSERSTTARIRQLLGKLQLDSQGWQGTRAVESGVCRR
jgi:hypothetical protein